MKKIIQFFFSTRFTGILLLLFALAMAVATFVENDYGSLTAKIYIYQAKWFEAILLLLVVNFVGNIGRHQLLRWEKLPVLLFHLAFIMIIIGAAITRYVSFDGAMPIAEGETEHSIISDQTYLYLKVYDQNVQKEYEYPTIFSELMNNDYSKSIQFKGKKIIFNLSNYIPNAVQEVERFVEGNEDTIVSIVTSSGGSGRENHYAQSGEIKLIQGVGFAINYPIDGAVNIFQENGTWKIKAPFNGSQMTMATQKTDSIFKNSTVDLKLRTLYQFEPVQFVVPEIIENAQLHWKKNKEKSEENQRDALHFLVRSGDEEKTIQFRGGKSFIDPVHRFQINGLNIAIRYGSKNITLPFGIKLVDFQMERYPGSDSPSSFASEIEVVEERKIIPYRIFMNSVLDYGGFRFFQASYFPDESGTILSVNHDFWGTWTSYLGYFLMVLSMFTTLFWKGSRFRKINSKWNKKTGKHFVAVVLFFVLMPFSFSQSLEEIPFINKDSAFQKQLVSSEHADRFGRLLVQDREGRIKPINSFAIEVMRKVYKKDRYLFKSQNGEKKQLTANQVLLGMHFDPIAWQRLPFIKIGTKARASLKDIVPFDSDGYTIPLAFFNQRAEYILKGFVEKAYQKKPSVQTEFDKEILKIDERVNIVWGIFFGNYLRIFPKRKDKNNTWYSYTDRKGGFTKRDSAFVHKLIPAYFWDLRQSQKTNDWTEAENKIKMIHAYQGIIGKDVIPSDQKVEWELKYNQWSIFYRLLMFYAVNGFLLIIFCFCTIFWKSKWLDYLTQIVSAFIFVGFVVHWAGLGLRWYVSGHAPWSNGYEATTFISSITVLAGLLFSLKNKFALASATLVAVMLLGIAHGSLMNPEITNLVPVLKSYWLMIHVAVITSSYGFLGLGSCLALLALILFIFRSHKNKIQINRSIEELTDINEMALTIGLFLLATGTFLGGIWANESWGRYWGWDPKETWALISVMVYAFVLHMRLIPGLRGNFGFNVASLSAISSIIMTFFGVNYYLSGLHSYAKGDPVPIPNWVYIAIAALVFIVLISYLRKRRHEFSMIDKET